MEKTDLSFYNIELEYFATQGRAEFIRIFLHDHGIAFKDVRFTSEEWEDVKKDPVQFTKDRYPFGMMPILRLVSKESAATRVISGSLVILAFLANAVGSPASPEIGMLTDYTNSAIVTTWSFLWSNEWNTTENYSALRSLANKMLEYIDYFLKESTNLLWQNNHLTSIGALNLQLLDMYKVLLQDSIVFPETLQKFYLIALKESKAQAYLTSKVHTDAPLNTSLPTPEQIANTRKTYG